MIPKWSLLVLFQILIKVEVYFHIHKIKPSFPHPDSLQIQNWEFPEFPELRIPRILSLGHISWEILEVSA